MKEVEEFVSFFFDQTLDSSKLTFLHKKLKSARLAMDDRVVLNCTNRELLTANLQKKKNNESNILAFNRIDVKLEF